MSERRKESKEDEGLPSSDCEQLRLTLSVVILLTDFFTRVGTGGTGSDNDINEALVYLITVPRNDVSERCMMVNVEMVHGKLDVNQIQYQ